MVDNLFRLAVGGICLHNNRIVLLRRRDDAEVYPAIWELPSGGVDLGEDASDAVVREVLEETGLRVKVGLCVGYFFYQSRGGVPCIQINHICELDGSNPSELRVSEEHTKAEWVELNRVFEFKISHNVRKIIEKTIHLVDRGIFLTQ